MLEVAKLLAGIQAKPSNIRIRWSAEGYQARNHHAAVVRNETSNANEGVNAVKNQIRIRSAVVVLSVLVTVFLFLAASSPESSAAPADRHYTAEQVVAAMTQAGLQPVGIFPKGGSMGRGAYAKLNGVLPATFSTDSHQMPNGGWSLTANLCIYVFPNEAARQEGRQAYAASVQASPRNARPAVFEAANILITHAKSNAERVDVDARLAKAISLLKS